MLQAKTRTGRRRAWARLAALCLVPFIGFSVPAAKAGDFSTPKGVVELFTSQGCRSCPPADRAFEQLVREGKVVALSYHVDYWNYLGWADTLATKENTARQYAYAKTFGRNGVYTPQAVLNGRDHLKGTDAAEVNRRLDRMNSNGKGLVVPVTASRHDDQLAISIGQGAGKANVVVVYFRQNQTVEVLKGENLGQSLSYWHSVTDVQTVGMWDGKSLDLTLPAKPMGDDKSDGIAILLQAADGAGNPSRIIGATVMKTTPKTL
ncbi:DUF1223 domain-containing protein [Rhizobium sp. WL3]|uniref:DUF1223 domain-containing protein n=1 Tax=Rhizobium sp. WL3 TaxID=2603277 RepID=UPI0011C1DE2F|nr:thioredoxin family protein [Rhizobium sp. WL3]QEE45765.1 DUF1223 domain-containing protein [Rhizobium sp. WL3]